MRGFFRRERGVTAELYRRATESVADDREYPAVFVLFSQGRDFDPRSSRDFAGYAADREAAVHNLVA
ncbi:MAG: hypothetical protein HOV68_17680 [Streptomycetaceae bacterium]|nr:hypothetical protein [Streptomycetaceae bacterium]